MNFVYPGAKRRNTDDGGKRHQGPEVRKCEALGGLSVTHPQGSGSGRWTLGHLGWPQIHNETANGNVQNSELSEYSLPRGISSRHEDREWQSPGMTAPGAFSHFLTVLRDSLARFAFSFLESRSRSFMCLTLPIISMVITSVSPAEHFSRPVEDPGQFSVGGNTSCKSD